MDAHYYIYIIFANCNKRSPLRQVKTNHIANLNGLYLNGTYTEYAVGMDWYPWKGHHYSFMKTKMMMRRN
jgi:hypothetical protein